MKIKVFSYLCTKIFDMKYSMNIRIFFLLAFCFSVLISTAQEIVYDKTTDGIRLVATSETICRSFTDRIVLAVSLHAIIDEQRQDTAFAVEAHITTDSPLEVTKNDHMRLTLYDGSTITLPVLKEDWNIVRDIHLVNGAILTSYDIIPLFSITREQIKAISNGVKHVFINVSPNAYDKEFKKDKIGAAISEEYRAICDRLGIIRPVVKAEKKYSYSLPDASDKPVLFPKLFGLNKSISYSVFGAGIDGFNYGAIGINFTVYGVYIDFMGWPRKHSGDVGIDVWQDHSQIAFHVGYQIPFHKFQDGNIRLIPVIGWARINEGYTDGSKWYVGSNGIVNSFRGTETKGGFDYGGVLVFRSQGKNVPTFSIGATRYTVWLGFGFDFLLRK